jgi:hydroxymethylpyrimidine/phosphomethylpyrimidine kinase
MARALGARGPAVLIKGGHGEGDEVVDLLFAGGEFHRFPHPRVATTSDHGTGCTLSSAIAARLAAGEALPAAVGGAIDYLQGALLAAYPLGAGRGPVNHLHRLKSSG